MDTKDKRKLEALWVKHREGDVWPSTIPAFEARLRNIQQVHHDFPEERKQSDFERAYAANGQLQILGKEQARSFFDETCATHSFPTDIDYLLSIGIYRAFHETDMSLLKDALHTWNRLKFGNRLHTPTGSHGYHFRELMYAMADCDIGLVKQYIPRELGLAERDCFPFFRVGSNLVAVMVYDNPRQTAVEKTLALAETYVGRKGSPKGSVFVVRYLMALLNGQVDEASHYLQCIANEYRKMTWLVEFHEFLKYFGAFVHGLYNLAHYVLPEAHFALLKTPEHSVFWGDFDRLTKERNFGTGTLIKGLNLTGNLGGLRRLLVDLP
ncbi:hypothetical protein NTJ56_20450 [Burkholderia contaminans]|uniref:hypothetical protein n=1 Tax=Burkholderia contaminans TaxID=488447 RepID=UPI001CF22F25|nr:hypothetical protein [Burkholderia contaminans]MCA7915787.1 hypothetical protein [Burkholderia contaminans]UUX40812.1 hypothetical protein NTJ56_20450 [Burkholderia contaminans]